MLLKTNPISTEYDLKEEIGKGSFSVVRRGVGRSNRQDYAVKIIDKASQGLHSIMAIWTESPKTKGQYPFTGQEGLRGGDRDPAAVRPAQEHHIAKGHV